MPEDPEVTPPGEEVTPPSPEDDAGPGGQGPGGQGGGSDLIPRSELSKANKEAQKYRTELREVQAKLKEFEDLGKTEQEKLTARATDLESRLEDREIELAEYRVRVLAPEAGITRDAAKDAFALLDLDRITDPNDDEQLLEALKDLVKTRPYLRGTREGADGGAGSTGSEDFGSDMNRLIRQAAGRGV
jgi:hypothetical protein